MGSHRETQLLGRNAELRQIGALLAHARNGRGGALLLAGEPGIGKTSLLEAATADLPGMQLLRVDGYEAESTMPFAALQRLTVPLREHLPALPENHQQALRVAAGSIAGPPPDRFLVGLGVLGLLAAAGDLRPVVCTVDDAYLLDSESLDALAFVARRLEAESAALVFASRHASHLEARVAGVPTLRVDGLAPEPAVQLLVSSLPETIDPALASQIAGATGGNPLALIDLAGGLSIRQLIEASLADEPLPVGHHLEAHYLRQVRELPPDVRRWLLIAAADSTGNLDLISAAAEQFDAPGSAGDEAEAAGLVELGVTVRFRHPLVRSAAYGAAAGFERRSVHAALASAALGLGMVELEAWHAAKSTLGTDADVADRLEKVADLAGERGGFSSRASVLVQASALTPGGPRKYTRLVGAAEAALAAGAAQLANTLLEEVDEGRLDPVARGRMVAVRASVAMFLSAPGPRRSVTDMLAAAAALGSEDIDRAQDALIQAFYFLLPAERQAEGTTLPELGRRLREGAELRGGTAATILQALSAHILLPYEQAVPLMREAVDTIGKLQGEELLQYGAVSVVFTSALWDATGRRECLERTAAAARDSGSLRVLDLVLWSMSIAELKGGTPRRAAQHMEQVRELRRAIGYDAENVINVAMLAWAGAPAAEVEMMAEGAGDLGWGGVHASGISALATRELAEGAYDSAYVRLKPLVDDPFLQVTPLEYPDFVEAAARSGHLDEAGEVAARLEAIAAANGSAWAEGVAQRSGALVDDHGAEPLYRAAITSLTSAGVELDLARTHLLYGEWLRRARRRRDARQHLRRAADIFDVVEAPAFAQRARNELEATGERSEQRQTRSGTDFTTQELTVAQLAASGHTNAEIGATMFISVNTVDYHLRKVFAKLGISSRRQLADHLAEV